jgi:hypothetical protein
MTAARANSVRLKSFAVIDAASDLSEGRIFIQLPASALANSMSRVTEISSRNSSATSSPAIEDERAITYERDFFKVA